MGKFSKIASKYLDPRLEQAITEQIGFTETTKVQTKAIPAVLTGKDVLIRAPTGSGKTLAYCIPLIQLLLRNKDPSKIACAPLKVAIIVPTRELCKQVYSVLKRLLFYCSDVISVAHTADLDNQPDPGRLDIFATTILISTPKAIVATFSGKNASTFSDNVKICVIDEADVMVELGFKQDMQTLASILPQSSSEKCQIILCSATLNTSANRLGLLLLFNPLTISIKNNTKKSNMTTDLKEYYVDCLEHDKWLYVYALVKLRLIPPKTIIYTSSVDRAYGLKLFFEKFGIPSEILSPTVPYSMRYNIIESFNQNIFEILIAPELAAGQQWAIEKAKAAKTSKLKKRKQSEAEDSEYFDMQRGIDFQAVNSILSFDPPTSLISYTHRVGRTARAGAKGISLCFFASDNQNEKSYKQMLLSQLTLGEAEESSSRLQLLQLELRDIECFRYRVEDVKKGVSAKSIAALRTRELEREILQDARLKNHFSDHTADYQALKKAARRLKEHHVVKQHLKHHPAYLTAKQPLIGPLNPVKEAIKTQHKQTVGLMQKTLNTGRSMFGDADVSELAPISGRKLWKLRHRKTVKKPGCQPLFESALKKKRKVQNKKARSIQNRKNRRK